MNSSPGRPVAQRLLLHTCCAPCASHSIEAACSQGFRPTLFFANDNLDSQCEFEKRLDSIRVLADRMKVPLLVSRWDHASWLQAVTGLQNEPEGGRRCLACFRHNLLKTARRAQEEGFDCFASTLTVSPHKRSATVFQAGREAQTAAGGADGTPAFIELDFKKKNGFLRSIELSRFHGLYRQNYCGCEFSRRE